MSRKKNSERRLLDEQRIDIVIAQRGHADYAPIVQAARRDGIKLVEA